MARSSSGNITRRPSRLTAVAAGGAGVLVVAIALALTLNRGGLPFLPGPGPSASHGPAYAPAPIPSLSAQEWDALLGKALPTPAITSTALLVANPSALTATELRWLNDLRANLGNTDAVAYRDAGADKLRAYFTVFVVDQSPDLDPSALAVAFDAGVSIHLAGNASVYAAKVSAGVTR